MTAGINARSLLSLLVHADKALDLVRTARDLDLLPRLDAGPVSLGALVEATGAKPLRLYKFLDGLESLGLVVRRQPSDELLASEYTSAEPLVPAVEAVLGEASIERERDGYPWREIHGRLRDVLTGSLDSRFAWPPETQDDIRAFERAMAAGCPPIIEAFRRAHDRLFARNEHWLDVGGGDGTVMAAVLRERSSLRGDVLNLEPVRPLVEERARAAEVDARMGFVAADFLAAPLPHGYDVLSFVRVLHDWPADVARMLLTKARDALPPGGRIVICEEFRDRDRLAVQFFWTYFLTGVDSCVSRLREVSWYVEALGALGFSDIEVVPGAFDLVVAQVG
jgi:hypothetical protein